MSKITLLDYEISSKGCLGDIGVAFKLLDFGVKGKYMACANPHSLVTAASDQLFKKALKASDILLPDGTGIVLASKLLNLKLTEKVAGSDFFRDCSIRANSVGNIRYFFLGSSQIVLDRIKKRLKKEYPGIVVCGTYSPPFKNEFSVKDNDLMIAKINDAKPDFLWVGMTAPKQEKWIYQNKERLDAKFIGAIGAVFDFYAGTKKRSSGIWIKLGLEWLPRFLKEPRRLWGRNIKSTPVFLWWIFKEKLKTYRIPKQL